MFCEATSLPNAVEGATPAESSTRSATGVSVSVSVDVLLAGVGSVEPRGTAALAVFDSDGNADGAMVPVAVNTADVPPLRSTVVLMLPLPEAGAQAPPAPGAQLQWTPVIVLGNVSVTATFLMLPVPGLVTVIV